MKQQGPALTISILLSIMLCLSALTAIAPPALAAVTPGDVWAWGANEYGQLGDGSNTNSNVPLPVRNLTGVIAVAGGFGHSLALDSTGRVWAWGRNDFGQLGDGTNVNSNVPLQVKNLTGIIAVAAGDLHSMALDSTGRVWTWGSNFSGILGNGTNVDSSNLPVRTSNLTGIIAIAGGGSHCLALSAGGIVWAWGYGGAGELGNGDNTYSNIPVRVSNIAGITAVAAGTLHSMALDSNGKVWTWGYNFDGELGNGTNTDSNVPVEASYLPRIGIVTGGDFHSLAVDLNGKAWAWGRNDYGQLGDNTTISRNLPVQVSNVIDAVGVDGGYHSLALDASGNVWSCGLNLSGQLGDGSNMNSPAPRLVALAGIASISVGSRHSLAIAHNTITTTSLTASSITLGQSVRDRATVRNQGTYPLLPTGTVTFQVSVDGMLWSAHGTLKTLYSSGTVTSDLYTPPAAGTYYLRALYGGDVNHNLSQSGNIDERLVVNKVRTSVTTRLSSSYIRLGRSITEQITISTTSAAALPPAGGTWTVQASKSYSFTSGVVTVHSGAVSGNLPFTITTKPFTPTSTGKWYFRTVYNGDNNFTSSSRMNTLTVIR